MIDYYLDVADVAVGTPATGPAYPARHGPP
jgi:hypothetical protein